MEHRSLTRVLALDLHAHSFGYAVVENPDRLLDWGVRSNRQRGDSLDVLIRKRLRPLLDLWRPSVLVLHDAARVARQNPRRDRLLKRIVAEAKNRRVHLRMLTKWPREGQGKRLTKQENARLVAERFPVLAQKMPPKRRAWESEDYRMSMFDAAFMAATYLARQASATICSGIAQ